MYVCIHYCRQKGYYNKNKMSKSLDDLNGVYTVSTHLSSSLSLSTSHTHTLFNSVPVCHLPFSFTCTHTVPLSPSPSHILSVHLYRSLSPFSLTHTLPFCPSFVLFFICSAILFTLLCLQNQPTICLHIYIQYCRNMHAIPCI